MDSAKFGVTSVRLGNPTIRNSQGAIAKAAGTLNRGGFWRIGWSVGPTKTGFAPVLRIGVGSKHIDLFFGKFFK
jgi:hypothetical protein